MPEATRRYRTIFLSDLHLGTRGCQAALVLDFLKHNDADTIFLVGDIIDGWRLRAGWYWPQQHNDVIQKLLRKVRHGARMVFVPGNHDEFARGYTDFAFGEVEVLDEAIHTAADGKRFLILHGDEFDGVVQYAKWLAHLGDHAYTLALAINHWFNWARRKLGYPYWSLSAYLKHKVKNAVQYIANFEQAMADVARLRGVDGVICGHIHHAELRQFGEITYANDGDWVESCSALVEHYDGRLEIIHWTVEDQLSLFNDPSEPKEAEEKACEFSSSPTPGILKSMGWFARLAR